MEREEVVEIVRAELSDIIRNSPDFRELSPGFPGWRYALKGETEDRFDRVLDELKRQREQQFRQWEENAERWKRTEQKWDENEQRWQDDQRQWEENAQRWKRTEQKWDENEERWRTNQKEITQLTEETQKIKVDVKGLTESIEKLHGLYVGGMGAIGARWGFYTEQSFRNALKGILEKNFQIQVINVVEFDDQGEVFGRPDQVELDIVITNGILLVCEIKSSVSKGDLHYFDRKVKFYEKKHDTQAHERIVISPMVADNASILAQELGIKVYSYTSEVDSKIFTRT